MTAITEMKKNIIGDDTDGPFDTEMRSFLKVCSNIITTKESKKIVTTTTNPYLKYLNNYTKAYELTAKTGDITIIKNDIFDTFRTNRMGILRGSGDDEWLRKGNVDLQYDVSSDREKKKHIRVAISVIYEMACIMQEETEERLKRLPKGSKQLAKEIDYPDELLLHFYKMIDIVFSQTNRKDSIADKDKKSIKKIINSLGGKEDTSSGAGGGMSSILNMAKGIASQMGVEVPDGAEMPSEDQMTGMFSSLMGNIMNNPTAKNTMTNLTNSLTAESKDGSPPDPAKIIGALLQGLNDPGLKELVASTVATTSSGALSESKNNVAGAGTVETVSTAIEVPTDSSVVIID